MPTLFISRCGSGNIYAEFTNYSLLKDPRETAAVEKFLETSVTLLICRMIRVIGSVKIAMPYSVCLSAYVQCLAYKAAPFFDCSI